MRRSTILLGSGALAALVAIPLLAQTKPASGPVARYDMRAGTISGAGAMGRGLGAAMSMMSGGGGNNVAHELYLRLGSSRAPDKGGAKADHFPPPATKLGKSVPLIAPQQEREPEEFPMQKPKGRLLIYWGCGEHAPKGQPVVIDFARLAAGQVPPGLWSSTILRDWGPTLSNSRTFARWPNEDAPGANRQLKSDSSLIGAHRVAGNYTPAMDFTLTKDFMAPLRVTTGATPAGGVLLRWSAIPDATGYVAGMFGGKPGAGGEMGDVVMWSSSATRQFGGGLSDWLSPAQVAGLVRDRTVLAPATTSCIVPAEVKRDTAGFAMGMLTAFGPEEDFAYPPRPANPQTPWALEWTARIRHRSMTSWMDMAGMGPGMGGMAGAEHDQPPPRGEPPKSCKPKRGLGGMIGAVTGTSSC